MFYVSFLIFKLWVWGVWGELLLLWTSNRYKRESHWQCPCKDSSQEGLERKWVCCLASCRASPFPAQEFVLVIVQVINPFWAWDWCSPSRSLQIGEKKMGKSVWQETHYFNTTVLALVPSDYVWIIERSGRSCSAWLRNGDMITAELKLAPISE